MEVAFPLLMNLIKPFVATAPFIALCGVPAPSAALDPVALRENGVLELRSLYPETDGAGVVVGVIDTGIDVTHEAFLGNDGRTRIEAIWDLCDTGGPPPEGFESYGGTLWTAADIDADLASGRLRRVRHRDISGHGTAVAAIAAGRGAAEEGRFEGVAPAARILVVSAGTPNDVGECANPVFRRDDGRSFLEAIIPAGLDWLAAAAGSRPLAVNISLGALFDFASGEQTEFEERITAWLKDQPGRSLAIAAGNRGLAPHWGLSLDATEPSRVLTVRTLIIREAGFATRSRAPLRFRGQFASRRCSEWVSDDHQSDRFSVQTTEERDARGTVYISVVKVTSAYDDVLLGITGCTRLTAQVEDLCGPTESAFVDTFSELCPSYVEVSADSCIRAATSCDAVRACLKSEQSLEIGLADPERHGGSPQRVDVWAGVGLAMWAPLIHAVGADTLMNITIPATSRGVLSVATWVHREEAHGMRASGYLGGLADYSGAGPTLDGRLGVSVAAPAEIITVARSHHGQALRETIVEPGWIAVHGGTSYAAPQVAGIAALLLQREPAAPASRIREAILVSARRDDQTGRDPNPRWGYGKVDALAAYEILSALGPDEDGDGFSAQASQGLDCDDLDPLVNPDAAEVADSIDNDCDGSVDEGLPTSALDRSTLDGSCIPGVEPEGHPIGGGMVGPDAWGCGGCRAVPGASARMLRFGLLVLLVVPVALARLRNSRPNTRPR